MIPTDDGMKLITVLPDVVKSPQLTADWENELVLVSKGEEIIESERLIMRRLKPDDYLAMAAWDMDERVYQYLPSSACKSPEEPLVWLPKKDPTSPVTILMLVLDKEDGHAVGTYALNHVVDRDVWTLSYVNRG